MDALTTNLETELSQKRRRAEATSATKAERESGSYSEKEAEEEDNNHTGTVSFQDSDPPKKQNIIEFGQVIFVWSHEGYWSHYA